MYNKKQLEAYLERIAYAGDLECTFENLSKLHFQHLLNIPYENLDLINGVPLKLDKESLYKKIVENHRGGYCFELQGAFYYLLRTLGYKVIQYAGRFMDEPWHIQMRRHRILVVELEDKQYVCDVGVCEEAPRYPLELKADIIQTDGVSEYRYENDEFYGWALYQKCKGKEWKPIVGFTEEPQIDEDYVMPSFYCEQHPESDFNKYMWASIFTEDSNCTILRNDFRIFRGGNTTETKTIESDDEAVKMLKGIFKIDVPDEYSQFIYDFKKAQEKI